MIGPYDHRGRRYVLRFWWEGPHRERAPRDVVDARAVLRSWLDEPGVGQDLRGFFLEAYAHLSPGYDDDLIRLIAAGVEQRLLAIDVLEPPAIRPPPAPERSSTETGADEPATERDWIGVELADVDGNLIKNAQLTVELADGTLRLVTTDERGRFELRGITPGSCKVTFTKLPKVEEMPRSKAMVI
jgi:hypothetical protein